MVSIVYGVFFYGVNHTLNCNIFTFCLLSASTLDIVSNMFHYCKQFVSQ